MSASPEVMLLITSCDRVSGSQEVLPETNALAIRFWSKVDRSGGPNSCWPWTGRPSTEGYGNFFFAGSHIGAHRQACILAHGEPPGPEMQACHSLTCTTKLCCNGLHLRWGSNADNQADVAIAGSRKGERHPLAKLNSDQARLIWSMRSGGAPAAAKAAGCSVSAARNILWGRTWTHVTGATPARAAGATP